MGLLPLFDRASTHANRGRRFRPQLEGLEARTVLSANSAAIHAVTDAQGHSAVFEMQQQGYKALYEHDAAHGFRQVGAAGYVDSFSGCHTSLQAPGQGNGHDRA